MHDFISRTFQKVKTTTVDVHLFNDELFLFINNNVYPINKIKIGFH